MRYPISIEIGTDSTAYGVAVPDLPGCFSAGDTIDEAIAKAEEAILLALEDYAEDGRPFPEASAIEDLRARGEYAGWTWALVNVDPSQLSSKAVRLNITMPSNVLRHVDAFVEQRDESRSGFLTRAAMNEMARAS
jgi:predicted RNase H-like HicB family nuclease